MDLNNFLFPSPNFNIDDFNNNSKNLIYIPKPNSSSLKDRFIPAVILTPLINSNNFLILFHGNAEDIFTVYSLAEEIKKYPGYSIYKTDKDADKLLDDALIVFDYLTDELNINSSNIYIYGRSIGSGPALYVSSKRKPGGLVLISPFTSIQAVAQESVGLLKFLVSERFTNIEYIKHVTCPILFIHGQEDKMVPCSHTIKLKQECTCPFEVILPEKMDHYIFDHKEDLILPLESFLMKHTYYSFECNDNFELKINDQLRIIPEYISSKLKLKK